MNSTSDVARDLFVVGLRDAHAVEHQALALINRQLDRLESYPEVAARLRQHKTETDGQIERLDTILASLNESPSAVKDTALSLAGNMAALGHMIAGDEILKNSFASFAFENFEAASYMGLITMAEAGGHNSAIPLLQQTLDEELAMAGWLRDNLPAVTMQFLELKSAGGQASR
jgi:ferritin-like metal-binding protein YciE